MQETVPRAEGLGFGIYGLGLRVLDLGFEIWGLGLRGRGSKYRNGLVFAT